MTKLFIDSQSVKWGVFGSDKGIDGHKKIKGIKRHLVVDTKGLPVNISVTNANVGDRFGAVGLMAQSTGKGMRIKDVIADKGYSGEHLKSLMDIIGINIECVKSNSKESGFIPSAGRWVVERTFAWIDNWRRLCRNFESLHHNARAMVMAASVLIVANRVDSIL